jgi:hypothetical protein
MAHTEVHVDHVKCPVLIKLDPPKRRFNRPHLHGATPQKTAFLNWNRLRNFTKLPQYQI